MISYDQLKEACQVQIRVRQGLEEGMILAYDYTISRMADQGWLTFKEAIELLGILGRDEETAKNYILRG